MNIEEIRELIENKQFTELKKELKDMKSADVSMILDELDKEQAVIIFRLLSKEKAGMTFSYMETDMREKLIKDLTDAELKNVLDELSKRLNIQDDLSGEYHPDKAILEKELDIAQKYNKPIIVHSRDSIQDTYNILKKYKWKRKSLAITPSDVNIFSQTSETLNGIAFKNIISQSQKNNTLNKRDHI